MSAVERRRASGDPLKRCLYPWQRQLVYLRRMAAILRDRGVNEALEPFRAAARYVEPDVAPYDFEAEYRWLVRYLLDECKRIRAAHRS